MQSNQSSRDHATYRADLYDVFEDETLSLAEKRRRALQLGREYLGVENGHVERVDGDTHEVVESVGDSGLLPPGTTLERATTYCRRTVQRDSPLALSHASEEGWSDDPAYDEHGFECYLGAPICVDGETYGTVCFLSRGRRERSFSALEQAFVELVARQLGRGLENETHERRLSEERRRARRTERKYEALLQAAPDAIFLIDAERETVVEGNEAAADLLGVDRCELPGTTVANLHPEDRRDQYRQVFRRCTTSKTMVSQLPDGTPLRMQRPDGSTVPVEINASTVEFDGRTLVQSVVRDVSDRHERQRELRLKDRAIEEASVGITIADADSEDLELVYANETFARMTGYDAEDVVGQNCRFLQGEGTDDETVTAVRRAIRNEEPITQEILNYRQDGTPFWNELTVAPVTDEDGRTTHYVGFQRDVTERTRQAQLDSVLKRILRHDFRNEMNVIIESARELADRETGAVEDLATTIVERGRYLSSLTEKAHRLRSEVGGDPRMELESVDCLQRSVEGAFESVDVVPADGVRELHVPARLDRAVRELVENAVDHGCQPVEVTVGRDGGDVAVTVSDDGDGIPEHERVLLRRGYETQLEHGDGVGLWLVNWLVTGVGGEVCVDDDGTTATVVVPATTDPEDNPFVAKTPLGSE